MKAPFVPSGQSERKNKIIREIKKNSTIFSIFEIIHFKTHINMKQRIVFDLILQQNVTTINWNKFQSLETWTYWIVHWWNENCLQLSNICQSSIILRFNSFIWLFSDISAFLLLLKSFNYQLKLTIVKILILNFNRIPYMKFSLQMCAWDPTSSTTLGFLLIRQESFVESC